jgi:hypothetical protein
VLCNRNIRSGCAQKVTVNLSEAGHMGNSGISRFHLHPGIERGIRHE